MNIRLSQCKCASLINMIQTAIIKPKIHYASWSETCSKPAGDLLASWSQTCVRA